MRKFAALAAGALAVALATAPATAQTRLMPTPAITIYPGETIKEGVITQREFAAVAIGDLPVVEAASALIGKVARRTLLPGQLIPRNAVEEARLVERGSPAQVVFNEDGLTIVAIASPLQSGGLGDMVRARNLDSGVTIVGRVQADGTIRVGE
ncbi:MAG: flagella basal body P-ring formation protein FlgA [Salinarimonadaceae bacterium]|nr:MAG: flagella basal body P-ring formation protein FlgA [Salinarimonadaceae bacterium]